MISSLIPKVSPAQGPGVEKPIEQEEIKEEDIKKENEESEPLDDWGYSEYRWALLKHIIEKNKEKEKEIFDKYLETEDGKDEYNKIKWEVERLYLSQDINHEDNVQEIARICKEHPTHSYINMRLATLYEKYEEFEKAAILFNNAAINSKNQEGNFYNLCQAAKSWAKVGNNIEIYSILNKLKDLKATIDDGEMLLLKVMADISNIINDDENYLPLMEGLLDEKPFDHNARFSLAYKYSQVDEHDISLNAYCFCSG